MANTRRTTQRNKESQENAPQERREDTNSNPPNTSAHDQAADVPEHQNLVQNSNIPSPPPSCKSKKSSSSVAKKKKQLYMLAEEEKAKIKMELIDKKLEADLAELDLEKYSSLSYGARTGKVENWLERSQQLNLAQLPPEDGQLAGEPLKASIHADVAAPLPAPAPMSNFAGAACNTVEMLARAVRDLAATSTNHNNNASLLSRISTPRDLPEYSGEPLEWLQFKQAYDESTAVCGFSARENLWRLRKCLRGPAKEAVSAMLISATTPDVIISTLQLRFGNPDQIIAKIIQDIHKIPAMSQNYQKEIVQFSVKVQDCMEAVKALGCEEYLQGMHIVSILLSKLPPILISKWSDYSFPIISKGKMSRLIILSEFLTTEALKIATTANHLVTFPRHESKIILSNSNAKKTHTVLVNTQNDKQNCKFCNHSVHILTECKKFKKALRKVKWQFVKRNRLCYKCLLSDHNRETCAAPSCDVDNCGSPHNRLLHYPKNNECTDNASPESTTTETVTHVNACNRKVLLKVVPISIYCHNHNEVINTSALLDSGSTVSLISSALAERAGLRGNIETIRMRGAWSDSEVVCDTSVIKIDISGYDNKIHSLRVRSIDNLDLPVQNLSLIDCKKYKNLSNLKYKFCNYDTKPEILIGQDNYNLMIPLKIKLGKCNEPSATLTPLGWCVHGCVRVPQTVHSHQVHDNLLISESTGHTSEETGDGSLLSLHEEVRRSFAIESMGISNKPRQNAEDLRAIDQLERTSVLVDGRWWVGLPWRDERCRMPDTYPAALKRLKSIEVKMSKDDGFAQRYVERIEHLLCNNFATELSTSSATTTEDKIWYLPHFGVDNPNKQSLRLVFDSANKVNGMCLNDYLLTGPDLLSSLFGIMLRFRENEVAVTGDIKDMFLRVKVRPEDQNAFRFLWRDTSSGPPKKYVSTSLVFGASCSPFIAQFIKNKNAKRYESSQPAAVEAICRSHYMDDYIDSLPDEATAIEMVRNVTYIHKAGGFHIRNWTSNSVAVLESMPKETLGTTAVKFKIGQQYEGERTLGLIWYPGEDELGFDISLKRIPDNIIRMKDRPTKRLMLRVIMSIFDVFGFLAPFTVQGKIMLQQTWQANIGWDDLIPDDIYEKWCKWLDILQHVNMVRIPRYYTQSGSDAARARLVSVAAHEAAAAGAPSPHRAPPSPSPAVPVHIQRATAGSYDAYASLNTTQPASRGISNEKYRCLQLHIFSDASTKAMSAVAYWRWIESGEVLLAFVASKCRVMPVKPITIPRAELQAALLAARLADTIAREHRLSADRRVFWCDSTTVLHWIRNNTRTYKTFEANRLGEIDELTNIHEWRYVPTKLNVADLATREVFDKKLFDNEWLRGPTFLCSDESSWPVDVIAPETKEVFDCVTLIQSERHILPVPDPNRFSSWLRLLRSTAVMLKFIDKCKRLQGDVDCDAMAQAELLLLKHAQENSFAEEINLLKNNKHIQRSSKLLTLSPYLDEDGVLRAGGRIDAAAGVSLEAKRPVILDGRHPVARLIVKYYHVKAAHGNQEAVVNHLKQKYWLIRLRPTVKHVVSQCMFCRIRKCKPQVPRMGDLPEARLAHHHRVFTFCGLDLFGPLEVTVGRGRQKRYGVLFTCLTVRAVHIELVSSLTSDSLIMALRRMAARRGWPQRMYSDNGTNLRGADKELKKSMEGLDADALKAAGVNNSMEWHFIPPSTPHWGGAWERLIRSIKTSLRAILNERAPREEVLLTLMAEVENIVNGRPLTHVAVEPGSIETLTPNHFLLGASSNLPTIGEFDNSDLSLRKQWRKAQRLTDMYWQRWVKEILPDLIPRKKWTDEQRPLQVGDLVFIVDPESPRNTWPRGVIQQVFPGKDGRVRLVEVRTRTGTWRRSAARVAPISLEG